MSTETRCDCGQKDQKIENQIANLHDFGLKENNLLRSVLKFSVQFDFHSGISGI